MRFETFSFELIYFLTEKVASKALTIPYQEGESKTFLDAKERAAHSLDYLWQLKDVLMALGSALVTLISAGIIILLWNWWLLPILLGLNLVSLPLLKRLRELEIDNNERSNPEARAFRYFTEISRDFRYAKDLRLYNGVELMIERSKKSMDRILAVNHEYFTKNGILDGLILTLVEFQSMIVFLILGTALFVGSITVGNFVLIYNAARQFGRVLSVLFEQGRVLLTIDLELASFLKFMRLPDESRSAAPSVEMSVTERIDQAIDLAKCGEVMLEVRDVCFAYPGSEQMILDHLSLEVLSSQTVALVGRNGAGKSTLVKLICRLYPPSSGEILLNGVNILDISLDVYYQLLSVTFQDFQLMPILLSENISSLLKGEQTLKDESQIRQVLAETDMLTWAEGQKGGIHTPLTRLIDEDGAIPSGGQEQKLAIARNIFHQGTLMILDEPTSALDPRSEEQVFGLMLELTRNRSAMFVSHRLSSTRYADHIFVLDQGRLIQEGVHEALMAEEGLYREMYQAQASQYQEVQPDIAS
jgi:ABC-type multidrug transport system fused ATPase/permease subunit